MARVQDAVSHCEHHSVPTFLGFLNPEEAAKAQAYCENRITYRLYGGYDHAERTVLACLPSWCEEPDYPILPLTFRYRKCDRLTHRDFLGALMALGITRESVGDILCEEGRTVVFVKREISSFIQSQCRKIGNVGVQITEEPLETIPQAGVLTEADTTVSSARLDAVVSALIGVSRTKSAALIADGAVTVNAVCCTKSTKMLASDDAVTVRGKGKFFVRSLEDFTKKGRVILRYAFYKS